MPDPKLEIPTYVIDAIIMSLNESIEVCYGASEQSAADYKKDYPYAVGYSKTTMESVVDSLLRLKLEHTIDL
jgi:hypothetical protein|tara:strand:+ start:44477 stop:44692 length:216 start_codon:yes stop_codon:yes gene_type:complete